MAIMVTNLERVRGALVREGMDLSVQRLDAHLKEDAEREAELTETRALYNELKDNSIKGFDELNLKYEQLREAVRAALHELGVPDENYAAPVANAVDILSRQLIEEEK